MICLQHIVKEFLCVTRSDIWTLDWIDFWPFSSFRSFVLADNLCSSLDHSIRSMEWGNHLDVSLPQHSDRKQEHLIPIKQKLSHKKPCNFFSNCTTCCIRKWRYTREFTSGKPWIRANSKKQKEELKRMVQHLQGTTKDKSIILMPRPRD